jgi:fructokinase
MRDIDVLCVGEALVDLLPDRRGPLETVERFRRAVGGAPGNVALGLARLGAKVGMVGVVGDDAFGRYLHGALSAEGVDTSGIYHTRAAKTGLTFISLSERGERSFSAYRDPGADMLLALDQVDGASAMFDRARVVHLGSTSLSRDPARQATWRAVALSKERGCLLSCDPNVRLHLWSDREEALKAARTLVASADIVKLSDDEAELLYGTRDPEQAARQVLAAGPRLVAGTVRERGASRAGRGCGELSPADPGAVGDDIGAGEVLETLPPEVMRRAAKRANWVGAAVVATLGATPGLPTLAAVIEQGGG